MTKATNSPTISFTGKNRLNLPVSQYKGLEKNFLGETTIGEIFRRMQEDKSLKNLSARLHAAKETDAAKYKEIKEKECPAFIPGIFPKKENEACQQYAPVLIFDVDHTVDEFCVSENIRMLKKNPFVFAAFPSVSGLGVRVVVFANSTPATHKQYYEAIAADLSKFLNIPTDKALRADLKAQGKEKAEIDAILKQTELIDTATNNLARIWFYSHVPKDLFYLNLDSQVYVLKDLLKTTKKQTKPTFQPVRDDEKVSVLLEKVNRQNIGAGRNNFVFAYASELCRHSVPKDRALAECLKCQESGFDESEVKKTVESAYKTTASGEFTDAQFVAYKRLLKGEKAKQEATAQPDTPQKKEDIQAVYSKGKEPKIVRMRNGLSRRYEFRLNEVSNEVEYSVKSEKQWQALNESDLIIELLEAGFTGVEQPLIALLKSSFVPKYDPFKNYFENLPKWNNNDPDYIEQLANFVDAKDQFWFNQQFKKALVRTIACALGVIPFNKQCFTLKGKQNDGKSSFLRFLVPPALKNYTSDAFDPNNKDGLFAICQNFIINLDELSQFSKADIRRVKAIFTFDHVKERLPYDRRPTNHRRRTSFVGSTNDDEFLIDETGNVRWLVFEIKGVKHDNGGKNGYSANIDINRVWAQAYALLKSGFIFQLTAEEIQKSERNNKGFQITTIEQELIQRYLKPCIESDEAEFMTATEIGELITPENRTPNLRNIGRALTLLEFEKGQKYDSRSGYQKKGYWVKRLSNE